MSFRLTERWQRTSSFGQLPRWGEVNFKVESHQVIQSSKAFRRKSFTRCWRDSRRKRKLLFSSVRSTMLHAGQESVPSSWHPPYCRNQAEDCIIETLQFLMPYFQNFDLGEINLSATEAEEAQARCSVFSCLLHSNCSRGLRRKSVSTVRCTRGSRVCRSLFPSSGCRFQKSD